MGEESKPVPVPDMGAGVKTMHQHRHVIADLIRNPEGRQGIQQASPTTVSFRAKRGI